MPARASALAVEPISQLRRRSVAVQIEIGDAGDVLAAPPSRPRAWCASSRDRSPKIFSTTLPRTPLTASSTLSLIGGEKLKRTPGISVSERAWPATSRSLSQPARPFVLRLQAHEGLGHVDAFVVRAVLGPPVLAQDLQHLGKLEEALADVDEHVLALGQRDAGRHLDEDVEVAFVELRQELRADARDGPAAGDDEHGARRSSGW